MYIADSSNNRIRKVTLSTDIISTIAGSSTSGSYTGDGGQAISATLNGPSGVALDSVGSIIDAYIVYGIKVFICFTYISALGNVYTSEYGNNCIRKVTISTGIISTIAGAGSTGYSGDGGQATSATLNHPSGIAFDSSGNLIIVIYCLHS